MSMLNTLSYKGYTARIDFDPDDNIFFGKVLGIRDQISFHGQTPNALRKDFESAIDFYLKTCEERGVDPQKPSSGKIMLRVPPEIHSAANIAAQASGKSLNQWAADVLQKAACG